MWCGFFYNSRGNEIDFVGLRHAGGSAPIHLRCLVSSRLVSSRLVSSRLVSSRLVSSRLVSSRLVSSRLVSSRLVSSRLVSSRLVSSRLVSSRLVSSRLVSSRRLAPLTTDVRRGGNEWSLLKLFAAVLPYFLIYLEGGGREVPTHMISLILAFEQILRHKSTGSAQSCKLCPLVYVSGDGSQHLLIYHNYSNRTSSSIRNPSEYRVVVLFYL